MMHCNKCGSSVSDAALKCYNCGNYVRSLDSGKSRVMFIILALFLGGLGIHRMYLGDWKLGILYLLFFWTGIPSIVALIEVFVVGLNNSNTRFIQE